MPSISRDASAMKEIVKSSFSALEEGQRKKNKVSAILTASDRPLDLRVDAIQYLLVHLHNFCVGCILVQENLLHYNWWDSHFPGIPSKKEKMANASRFNEMLIYSCFLGTFSIFESYIRSVLFSVEGGIDVKRNENFYKQRKRLYETTISIDFPRLDEYFQLMQILRNCIHNHGVYYDPKFPNVKLCYDNYEYVFKNDLPPNCMQPEFLIERISDAIDIISKTSTHPTVVNVSRIEDRYDLLGTYETKSTG